MCLLYVSLGSRVSPSLLEYQFARSVMLSICSSRCVLYSAGSGVKRVHVVLSRLRIMLFVCFHVCIVLPVGMIEYLFLLCLCRCVLMLW